ARRMAEQSAQQQHHGYWRFVDFEHCVLRVREPPTTSRPEHSPPSWKSLVCLNETDLRLVPLQVDDPLPWV
ncbi:MAG: hypothetical protein WAK66_07250, partial [Methylocystis sp.]